MMSTRSMWAQDTNSSGYISIYNRNKNLECNSVQNNMTVVGACMLSYYQQQKSPSKRIGISILKQHFLFLQSKSRLQLRNVMFRMQKQSGFSVRVVFNGVHNYCKKNLNLCLKHPFEMQKVSETSDLSSFNCKYSETKHTNINTLLKVFLFVS